MSTLGEYLKNVRLEVGYSLKDVAKQTDITDSRLSRMERNNTYLSPDEIRKLANIYKVPIVKLYIQAGYLTNEDLLEYQKVFHGTSALTDEEKKHIQECIDLLIRGRVQK